MCKALFHCLGVENRKAGGYFQHFLGQLQDKVYINSLLFWREVQAYKVLFVGRRFSPCAVEMKSKVGDTDYRPLCFVIAVGVVVIIENHVVLVNRKVNLQYQFMTHIDNSTIFICANVVIYTYTRKKPLLLFILIHFFGSTAHCTSQETSLSYFGFLLAVH